MLIEHSAAGLRVEHDGVAHASDLRLEGWAPARGWRFAFGARTGMDSDDHHVADVLLEAGAAFHPEEVPLDVTLNGQDFSDGGLRFEYGVTSSGDA